MTNRLLVTGVVGSSVAFVCCFTPLLVLLLSALGLAAITGYLDYILLPALAGFLGIALFGAVQLHRGKEGSCCPSDLESQQDR